MLQKDRKKMTCFNVHAGGKLTFQCIVNEGIYSWNRMWSLTRESRASLHAVQYK